MHPSVAELADFLLGNLPLEKCDEVANHLEDCPPCQETVNQIDTSSDTLVKVLKQAVKPAPINSVCQQAINKAIKIAHRPSQVDAPSAVGIQGDTATKFRLVNSPAAEVSIPQVASSAIANDGTKVLSKDEILAQLKLANLIAEEVWPTIQSDIAAATTGEQLVKKLFERGLLNKFQAQNLYQGRAKWLSFGEYIVLDKIGAGGMGQVFKARHRRMDRLVALKVMAGAAMKDPEAVKRFQREVKAAAKLVHPNIVTAFDAGEHGKVFYLVMEFVDGHDLSGFVKKNGPLPVADAVEAILQAARGLAFAHAEGVVHRDIKPANLLRDKKGVVRVLDMGLARIDDPLGKTKDEGLTQSGAVMGTVDYMAPEQAFNTRDAGPAADVYSLGCTLYSLVVGQQIYSGESMIEKILAHREKPIPPLQSKTGKVPPALAQLFERMVAKDAAGRPTMVEVVAALESLKANSSTANSPPAAAAPLVNVSRPVSKPEKVKPSAEVSPAVPIKWIIAAAAAGIVLLLATWVIIRNREGKEIARVKVPDGSSVTVQPEVPPQPPAANKNLVEMPASPVNSKPPSSATPLAPSPTASTTPSPATPKTTAQPGAPHYLKFSGKDRVEIPTLKYDGSHDLTIEAIVSFKETPKDKASVIFSNFPAKPTAPTTPAGMYLRVNNSSPPLSMFNVIFRGPGPSLGSMSRGIEFDATWHHLTIEFSEAISCYFNGRRMLHLRGRDRTQHVPSASSFMLGDLSGTGSYGFDGAMQGFRFSKIARYKGDYDPPAQLSVDSDCVAVYRFEEGTGNVLKDSSGNGHHGKITGAKWVKNEDLSSVVVPAERPPPNVFSDSNSPRTPSTYPVNPKGPYYLEFDGDDRVEIPTLKYDGSHDLTIEAIVSVPVTTQPTNGVIIGNYRESGENESQNEGVSLAMMNLETLTMKFVHAAPNNFSKRGGITASVDTRYHETSRWHHLALQLGESRISTFADGCLRAPQSTGRSTIRHSNSSWWIGDSRLEQNPGGFIGSIQSVRLSKSLRYKGTYNPSAVFEPDADTIALYRFEEGSGDVLKDSSGNGHHGKIIGAKWGKVDSANTPGN